MSDIALLVGGRSYSGWESVAVTRGIESICGGFSLTVSERWADQREPWPIREGDECRVKIGKDTIITGYVDSRTIRYSKTEHAFSVTGRDKASDLVDCSAVLDTWEFNEQKADQIVRAVAEPFGITVTVAPGVTLPEPQSRFAINPGEKAFEVIDRICRQSGVLPVSDGQGGIILTRAGSRRATTELVQGGNILEASVGCSHEDRFRRYILSTQNVGDDYYFADLVAGVEAEAVDLNVRRPRVLYVRGENIAHQDQAQERVNWECAVRAGRAEEFSVTVQGWRQGDGSPWPVNALVRVRSPLLGVDEDLLITQAQHLANRRSGTVTVLTLKRPEAFTPQPVFPEVDPTEFLFQ